MLINQVEQESQTTTGKNTNNHVFLFLEIFLREGGVQSYVKDIFRSYLQLDETYQANVFILRDSPNCDNPFDSEKLKFHYFSSIHP
ncbi:MAG: glycosyl transferase group 1, partial [Cuspidothrix sp.]